MLLHKNTAGGTTFQGRACPERWKTAVMNVEPMLARREFAGIYLAPSGISHGIKDVDVQTIGRVGGGEIAS